MPKAKSKPKPKPKPATDHTSPTKPRPKPKPKSKSKSKSKPNTRSSTQGKKNANPNVSTAPQKPPLFFWKEMDREVGFLSPWYRSPFQSEGVKYESAGHFLMARKAEAFGDEEALQKILASKSADEMKTLGDDVKGFDEFQWQMQGPVFAESAHLKKFFGAAGSRKLLKRLTDLGDRELVLADPSDSFLGIGFGALEAEQVGREQWGENIFGKTLDVVRKRDNSTEVKKVESPFEKFGGRMNVYW